MERSRSGKGKREGMFSVCIYVKVIAKGGRKKGKSCIECSLDFHEGLCLPYKHTTYG